MAFSSLPGGNPGLGVGLAWTPPPGRPLTGRRMALAEPPGPHASPRAPPVKPAVCAPWGSSLKSSPCRSGSCSVARYRNRTTVACLTPCWLASVLDRSQEVRGRAPREGEWLGVRWGVLCSPPSSARVSIHAHHVSVHFQASPTLQGGGEGAKVFESTFQKSHLWTCSSGRLAPAGPQHQEQEEAGRAAGSAAPGTGTQRQRPGVPSGDALASEAPCL